MKWSFQFWYAHRQQVAVVAPVEEALAGVLLHLALQEGQQVVAVDVDLEGLVAGLVALLELLDDVGLAGGSQQRRQHVGVGEDLVGHRPRLDDAGPADGAGHTPAALPVGVLLARGTASTRRRASSGTRRHCRWSTSRWCCRRCPARRACPAAGRRGRRAPPCRRDRRPGRSTPWDSFFRWVQTCMRVEFHQQKKGLPSRWPSP